ncbi:ATP-binding protein [Kitasatospora cineracea]|uniref:ATP-binding protein n=1 Tax=Kitasatospora cineracea TaxID=88074 RepID=UPI0033EB443D
MHVVITSFTIPARRVCAGEVRNRLLRDLADVPLTPDQRDIVRLASSELFTNGLEHGIGGEDGDQDLRVEVAEYRVRGRLRVTITNPCRTSTTRAIRAAALGPYAEGGRGLFIVEQMAEAVGSDLIVDLNGQRRAVWFEIAATLPAVSSDSEVAELPASRREPPATQQLEGQTIRARRSVVRRAAGRLYRLPRRITARQGSQTRTVSGERAA